MTSTLSPPLPNTRRSAGNRDEAQLRPLFRRWQMHKDERAREALIQRFTPVARSLARRYKHSSEPFEDLLQVAMLALLKALNRFDPDRGSTFVSFAVPTILGELRRYFRDAGWAIHVPRSLQERALETVRAQDRITQTRGRAPTLCELAAYLELSVEEVHEAFLAAQAYDPVSLETPHTVDDGEAQPRSETIGAIDDRYELIECDDAVCNALQKITPQQRRILYLRFVEELTQTEIAARVGVSQMQISRQLRSSLDRLRSLAAAPQP